MNFHRNCEQGSAALSIAAMVAVGLAAITVLEMKKTQQASKIVAKNVNLSVSNAIIKEGLEIANVMFSNGVLSAGKPTLESRFPIVVLNSQPAEGHSWGRRREHRETVDGIEQRVKILSSGGPSIIQISANDPRCGEVDPQQPKDGKCDPTNFQHNVSIQVNRFITENVAGEDENYLQVVASVESPEFGSLDATIKLDPAGVIRTCPNLVKNPGFEQDLQDFTSTYLTGWQDPNYWNIRQGQWPGWIMAIDNPRNWNPAFASVTGNGKMLFVNSASTGSTKFYCQNIPVEPSLNYEFSFRHRTVMPRGSPSLRWFINNNGITGFIQTRGSWRNEVVTWNSGTATTAELCAINGSTVYDGSDFAIDDLDFHDTSCD